MPDGKRGYLAGKVGTEVFHRILSGAMHQDEAFQIKRSKIGRCAFEPIFTGMSQMKSADDGSDGEVRTGFLTGFDRIDNPGVAAAGNQYAAGQQERLFLRDAHRLPIKLPEAPKLNFLQCSLVGDFFR